MPIIVAIILILILLHSTVLTSLDAITASSKRVRDKLVAGDPKLALMK